MQAFKYARHYFKSPPWLMSLQNELCIFKINIFLFYTDGMHTNPDVKNFI